MSALTPDRPAATIPCCWICGATQLHFYKSNNIPDQIGSNDFRITDSHYGVTAELMKCDRCGFIQASHLDNVLTFYEGMSDDNYENTRLERSLQARKLLETLKRTLPQGHLLDVGAGSGILVEEALRLGYQAEGIEPSRWLAEQGKKRGFTVYEGILPSAEIKRTYQAVTLIDVIEHVSDPIGVLREIAEVLEPQGLLFVVTPDMSSGAARLLRNRWWHLRIAHIGYFTLATLDRAMDHTGFKRLSWFRPAWYFPLEYLWLRLQRYLPFFRWLPLPQPLRKITIPLNLRDSIAAIYQKKA